MEISKQKKEIIILVFKMYAVMYLLNSFYNFGEVIGKFIYNITH